MISAIQSKSPLWGRFDALAHPVCELPAYSNANCAQRMRKYLLLHSCASATFLSLAVVLTYVTERPDSRFSASW